MPSETNHLHERATSGASPIGRTSFRHEALLYAGIEQFVDRTMPFVRGALTRGEPVMVMVSRPKIELLRAALGSDRKRVQFADMEQVGRNPARILPAWSDFCAERATRSGGLRGIGEPVWVGRTAAAFEESQHHELLLNEAFADAGNIWLLCPYDTSSLPSAAIREAYRSHPEVTERDGARRASDTYDGAAARSATLEAPLPEPAGAPDWVEFHAGHMAALRELAARSAAAIGLPRARACDFVLAVDEIASNSIRHGGGTGQARVWDDAGTLVCEIRDRGRLDDPMLGRRRPGFAQHGGRGLWIANRCCDLVQLRSAPGEGTTVRLHMHAHS